MSDQNEATRTTERYGKRRIGRAVRRARSLPPGRYRTTSRARNGSRLRDDGRLAVEGVSGPAPNPIAGKTPQRRAGRDARSPKG